MSRTAAMGIPKLLAGPQKSGIGCEQVFKVLGYSRRALQLLAMPCDSLASHLVQKSHLSKNSPSHAFDITLSLEVLLTCRAEVAEGRVCPDFGVRRLDNRSHGSGCCASKLQLDAFCSSFFSRAHDQTSGLTVRVLQETQ